MPRLRRGCARSSAPAVKHRKGAVPVKVTKTEKIWLGLTVLFFALYNLPGVPAYGDARGLLVHALLTVLPLWICVYAGLFKVLRRYKLKKKK